MPQCGRACVLPPSAFRSFPPVGCAPFAPSLLALPLLSPRPRSCPARLPCPSRNPPARPRAFLSLLIPRPCDLPSRALFTSFCPPPFFFGPNPPPALPYTPRRLGSIPSTPAAPGFSHLLWSRPLTCAAAPWSPVPPSVELRSSLFSRACSPYSGGTPPIARIRPLLCYPTPSLSSSRPLPHHTRYAWCTRARA